MKHHSSFFNLVGMSSNFEICMEKLKAILEVSMNIFNPYT